MNILHIGASDGEEINFYDYCGAETLVYVEPDIHALKKLKENIAKYQQAINAGMVIHVLNKACSDRIGEKIVLKANGKGQSSILDIGPRTKSWVGDEFEEYEVETTTINKIMDTNCSSYANDYICIDTQGYEYTIMKDVNKEKFREKFAMVDIEIMTDPYQYNIEEGQHKRLIYLLLNLGYEPVAIPMDKTESYLFLKSDFYQRNKAWMDILIKESAYKCEQELFKEALKKDDVDIGSNYIKTILMTSKGFHPLLKVTGQVHESKLDKFRKVLFEKITNVSNLLI
ncbi:FkbM family methyltransferase [Synechococcus sp. PROS-U-1]|uniref:FkbM family methyltransferase n=1 Tax=Synechococcus sp. PROS-U-1 TaxID=1400866 RepID=UPI001645E863|nr:FkbM family methyltransferase [Synechococcus sp. PROS-U-1]QNJ01760.1 methyltransferase/ FkbM family domain protein [Synechococcus sp. PROS-U-1]